MGVFKYVMAIRASRRNQELALRAQDHAAETRQAQLYIQFYSFYDDKGFLRDYGNIGTVYSYDDIGDWVGKYSAQLTVKFENRRAPQESVDSSSARASYVVCIRRTPVRAYMVCYDYAGVIRC